MFVKFFVRNFGSGNGCASFMGVWDFWFFLQENPHAHKMPRFKSGYFGFFLGGGGVGKCQFYFYGRGNFSDPP